MTYFPSPSLLDWVWMWQICVIVNQVSTDFWISERTPAVCGTLEGPILFCLPSICDRIFSTEMRWLRNKGSMWSCKLTALSDYPLTTTIKSSIQSYPTTYKDKSADDHNYQRCFILIWLNLPPIVMLMSQYNTRKAKDLWTCTRRQLQFHPQMYEIV